MNKMINHFSIQICFGFAVADMVLLFHLLSRVVPVRQAELQFDASMGIPYVVAIATTVVFARYVQFRRAAYERLLEKSPGRPVEATTGAE